MTAVYWINGLLRRSWHFVSMPDFFVMLRGILIAVLVLTIVTYFMAPLTAVPHTVPLITCFIMITAMGGVRIAYRWTIESGIAQVVASMRSDEVGYYSLPEYSNVLLLKQRGTKILQQRGKSIERRVGGLSFRHIVERKIQSWGGCCRPRDLRAGYEIGPRGLRDDAVLVAYHSVKARSKRCTSFNLQ
ncbi:MAG: hypothetical protein ACREYF_11155 [Gammaproteobacteria bacterium]